MSQVVIAGLCGVVAYFIGNISPSIILAKKQGIDIKSEGSGNAGTTNALRVMGKKAGAVTLVIDILKGVVAVLIGLFAAGNLGASICGLMVYLGHVWPMLYKFKGGKGVATTFGAVLAVSPLVAFLSLGIVLLMVLISKRMSVGSIIGAICLPILCFFLKPWYAPVTLVIAVIVIIMHRANIVRLIHGQEPIMSIFEKKQQGE
ncbi:MAG: glycerol-3-phosphate 1-O-acyltransferase PlsY [Eubacteriales bacterium]|nr:glycerol-3-phosphate 1-O-acyltransferase PlsY [Eubacteriales bacterium]